MTCQMRKSPACTSASLRQVRSRANINSWISKPLRLGEFEQLLARTELVRRRAAGRAGIHFRPGANDETAADAVVLLARQQILRGIMRGETHAVGMAGQHLIGVKQEIQGLVEIDLVPAQQAQALGVANPLQRNLDGARIDAFRAHALET